jgi:hypothetical protein
MPVVMVVIDPESSHYLRGMEHTLLKVARQQSWAEKNAEEDVVGGKKPVAVYEFLRYH